MSLYKTTYLTILILLLSLAVGGYAQANRAQLVEQNRIFTLETIKNTEQIEELIAESYKLCATDILLGEKYAERALHLADSLQIEKAQGEALRALANIHLFRGQNRSAIETYYRAIEMSRLAKDSMNIAKCLSNIGLTYHDQLDYPRSIEFFQKAAPYFIEMGDNYTLSAVFYNIMLSEFSLGNYYKAMSMNEKSLYYAKQSHSARREGDCYMAQGMILLALKDSVEGTRKIENAITFFRSQGITDQISAAYAELAWDFNSRKLYDKSNDALYAAIENNDNALNSPQAVRICQLFSENYLHLGNREAAINYLKQAIDASIKFENLVAKGVTLSRLAEIYRQMEEYDRAIAYYNDACNAFFQCDNLRLYWQEMNNIASIHIVINQPRKAIEHALPAYRYGNESHNIDILANSSSLLEEAYVKIGEMKEAYHFAKRGEAYRDSLKQFNQEKMIENLHLNFDFTEKLKEEQRNQYLTQLTYETRIRRQNSSIIFILIIAVAAILFAIHLVRNNREKRKALELLNRLHKESVEQKKQISDQNRELQQHHDHLEETVKSRTHELFVAKEQAIESERLKISFMRKITHELRTPLNAVVGFSDILAEESSEEFDHFKEVIRENNDKILIVLEDLNNLVVTNSSSDFANTINFSAGELFYELEQMYPQRLSGLSLIFRYPEEDFQINQSKRKIKQVLTILINNALSFTDVGEVIVKINLYGSEILFEVEDHGVGITPEHQLLIFTEGYKVDPSTPGKGIGLFIGQKIANSIDGKIRVEAIPEQGSRFFFSLPKNSRLTDTLPEE